MSERFVPGSEGSISNYVEKHHRARYRWAIQQLAGLDGLILDIACGAGYGSRMLADSRGRTVIGIDASAEAVAGAAAAYFQSNLSFQMGDAENLASIKTGSVSALVSFETIEHLRHPERFLQEAARVLSDDGVMLISTPNRLLASTLYPLRGRPNNPFHEFEYTLRGFRRDVERFFVIKTMGGQRYVHRWLAFWPVQVAVKALCRSLSQFGAYRLIDRYYHNPDDVEVWPLDAFPAADPTIFVAVCTPR